jgi:hypothetical protein
MNVYEYEKGKLIGAIDEINSMITFVKATEKIDKQVLINYLANRARSAETKSLEMMNGVEKNGHTKNLLDNDKLIRR